jgi:hypothetical protein
MWCLTQQKQQLGWTRCTRQITKKADFYEALENRVISLLDVLGYSGSLLDVGAADLDPRPIPVNTSVVSTDWRRQIVNAVPALNPSGVPPAE